MEALIKDIEQKCSNVLTFATNQFMFLSLSDIYIAGGAIRELFLNKPVNDYDIYFKTKKVAKRFTKEWINFISYTKFGILAVTKNAITIQLTSGEKLQFITRDIYCGRPDQVIERFDFTHSMCYYYRNLLITTDEMMLACRTNRLIYNKGCYFPINTVKRLIKFLYRGWGINLYEIFRICLYSVKDVNNYKELSNSSY